MALIKLQDISLSFGGPTLLDDISFQIHEGEKICLLGRNGVGKSCLMKIIHNSLDQDSGERIVESYIRTALLSQDVPDTLSGPIYDCIAAGFSNLQSEDFDGHEEQKKHTQIKKTLSLLSLDGHLEAGVLSAGMKRRVLLGRALVNDPDILLLDEPTNHLDLETIEWLENFLDRYEKAIFFVTHDRMFLQRIANRILELDRGRLFDWSCDYRTFLKRKEAWLESEEQQNVNFDKKLAKEEQWIRRGIKARRTRNEGRVRALKKMRDERTARRNQQGTARMEIQDSSPSGKIVIKAKDISFSYGNNIILKNFSTTIIRGDRIGIIGPNGCGKSTLIKVLLQELELQKGTVQIGTRLNIAYSDQMRNKLDEDKTVKENVTDGNELIDINGRQKHVIGYLQDFLFTPDRAAQPVKALSGGEKNRLLLAKLFTKAANFLVLDEPTNDLDLETMELLEERLLAYQGTLLLVSHDREFLNNVVTSTLCFRKDGIVEEGIGGYDEWKQRSPKSIPPAKEKKIREKKPKLKARLSFKENLELDEVPIVIEEKEKQKDQCVAKLGDPAFYKEQGHNIAALKNQLEDIDTELEKLYLRWDELEEMKLKFSKQ